MSEKNLLTLPTDQKGPGGEPAPRPTNPRIERALSELVRKHEAVADLVRLMLQTDRHGVADHLAPVLTEKCDHMAVALDDIESVVYELLDIDRPGDDVEEGP